jgi:hypothetical protein
MNEPQPAPRPEPDTTVLHISRFVAGEPGETTEDAESPTLFLKRAAEQAAEKSLEPVVAPKDSALPPKQMLGAVAYAYTKGVFRSEDIERKMLQDPQFRSALGNEVPNASSIRRFRRLNRSAILATLGKFFRWRRARTSAGAPGASAAPAEQNTQFYVKGEAEDVLNKASWVDNMSKED